MYVCVADYTSQPKYICDFVLPHMIHRHVPSYTGPCNVIDCAGGYECLIYEPTGEGYCSPNCEELNPCAPNQQCVTTDVICIRSPCPPVLSCEGNNICLALSYRPGQLSFLGSSVHRVPT